MKAVQTTCSLMAIVLFMSAIMQPCLAKSIRASGARGTAAAGTHKFQGQHGGTFAGGGARFRTAGVGFGVAGFKGVGPRGGSGQGGAIGGFKRGVGGFEGSRMSLNGPGGSTYNGFTKGVYNAQTQQGSYNASHQVYDAKNGKTYGDTNSTSYSNGKGVTQLDTQNHGDYTIDWGKGQKPDLTKDTTGQ